MHQLTDFPCVRSDYTLEDPLFVERLIAFYGHQHHQARMTKIWDGILAAYEGPLHWALLSRDLRLVTTCLHNLYEPKVIWGMDIPLGDHFRPAWEANAINLGTALGFIPQFNQEQPIDLLFDAATFCDQVEATTGIQIHHVGGMGMPGAQIGGRFIPFKLLNALLIHKLTLPGAQCLELGAGIGMMGYLIAKQDFAIYHTIDLPLASVIQAWHLRLATSPENVWLAGEPEPQEQLIRIHGLQPLPEGLRLDWVLNQDSLPEIAEDQAIDYVKLIAGKLRDDSSRFFSINQESCREGQHNSAELIHRHTTLIRHTRMPWWLRAGYVYEEWSL
jgi:hypothetical protein